MNNSNPTRPNVSEGFTLIELMVTILVVAILAAIAVPTYSMQVRKSRRTEARSALLDVAAREERYYATMSTYTATAANVGYNALPVTVGSGYYNLNVACSPSATNCTSFTATATATGTQTKDAACTALTLTNTGVQGSTGTAAAATCWN